MGEVGTKENQMRNLVTAGIAAISFAVAGANAAVIDLEASDNDVRVGETFEVELSYTSTSTMQFLSEVFGDFTFNSDLFEFVSASFIDPGTLRNELDLPNDPNDIGGAVFDVTEIAPGELELDLFSSNGFDFLAMNQADDFAPVTLTFRAVDTGTGELGLGEFFEIFAGFDEIDPIIVDDTVTVDVAPVPVPAAALLFAPAALLLRRKRS
jgi:hypothetical protein